MRRQGWVMVVLVLSQALAQVADTVHTVKGLGEWEQLVSDKQNFAKLDKIVELLDGVGIIKPILQKTSFAQRLQFLHQIKAMAPAFQRLLGILPETSGRSKQIVEMSRQLAGEQILLALEPQIVQVLGQPPIGFEHILMDPSRNPAWNLVNPTKLTSYNQNPIYQAIAQQPQFQKAMAEVPPQLFAIDWAAMSILAGVVVLGVLIKGMKDKVSCEFFIDRKKANSEKAEVETQLTSAREIHQEVITKAVHDGDSSDGSERSEEMMPKVEANLLDTMGRDTTARRPGIDPEDLTADDRIRLWNAKNNPCGARPSYKDDPVYQRHYHSHKQALLDSGGDGVPPPMDDWRKYIPLTREKPKKGRRRGPVPAPPNAQSMSKDGIDKHMGNLRGLLDGGEGLLASGADSILQIVSESPEEYCVQPYVQQQPGFVLMELFLRRFRDNTEAETGTSQSDQVRWGVKKLEHK